MSADINRKIFKPHSFRSASVSKAKVIGVPTSVMLEKKVLEERAHLKNYNSKTQGAE